MASQEQELFGVEPESGGSSGQPGNRLEGLYASGMELFLEGKFAEAVENFNKALQLTRNHSGSINFLGKSLFHLGHYNRALELFQLFLRKEPDNEETLWYCGMVCLQLSRFTEAERCHRKVVSLNPKSARGYIGLGQVFYRKGLYNDAVGMFARADELESNNPEILFQLGEAYNKIDEINKAITCFETVLKKVQDNPKVYYNLGILYDKKSMPDKASHMYRQAKELSSPKQTPGRSATLVTDTGEDMFFSRSLTVVNQVSETARYDNLDKERYEKFRDKQLKKKPHKILEDEQALVENAGKMDLTKASLKINEAINIIKEKRK